MLIEGKGSFLYNKKTLLTAALLLILANIVLSSMLHTYTVTAQQSVTDTNTASPTASYTVTVGTPETETLTSTPDLTITVTPTMTPGLTLTSTPTFGVAVTFTTTPTSNIAATPSVTEIIPTSTATPTYLPLPSITMIYPKITATPYLMMAYRDGRSVHKQRLPFFLSLLMRFWPLGVMFIVWGILGVWFIFIQHKMD